MTGSLSASSQELEGGLYVVSVAGELDISTAPKLEALLDAVAAAAPRSVIVELDDVTFVDSSGLRVLVAYRNRFDDDESGARFVIDGMTPAVRRVFEVAGLLERLAAPDDEPGQP